MVQVKNNNQVSNQLRKSKLFRHLLHLPCHVKPHVEFRYVYTHITTIYEMWSEQRIFPDLVNKSIISTTYG